MGKGKFYGKMTNKKKYIQIQKDNKLFSKILSTHPN